MEYYASNNGQPIYYVIGTTEEIKDAYDKFCNHELCTKEFENTATFSMHKRAYALRVEYHPKETVQKKYYTFSVVNSDTMLSLIASGEVFPSEVRENQYDKLCGVKQLI